MITIPEVVQQIIHTTPLFEEALSLKILNISGLARLIKPKVEEKVMKDVEIGSIIMALKRMNVEFKTTGKFRKIFETSADIIVRSNLFEITVQNSESQIAKHKMLLEYASDHTSAFITVTHGVFETTIIAHADLKEKILKLYKNEKIIAELHNLSSVTVKFTENIIDTPGVYYMILKTLAWGGIDIVEFVSTYSECTIILKNEHVDRAFTRIKKLFKSM